MLSGIRSTAPCLQTTRGSTESCDSLGWSHARIPANNDLISATLQRTATRRTTSWLSCRSATQCWTQRGCTAACKFAARRTVVVRSSVAAGEDIIVRSTTVTEYLRQASVLRADAYYEEQPSARYTGTFKRQFADQSTRDLTNKTSGSAESGVPECVCMVAIHSETDQVLATCDVRPPANIARQHPQGVPTNDATGCYITNVAVDSGTRGQGIGFQLLEAAAAYATELWQAAAAYTTVDTNNEAATKLYSKCGFNTVSVENSDGQADNSEGPLALLRADLPLKCNIDD